MARGRVIPQPGYYMVRSSRGSGIVHWDRAGILDQHGILSAPDSAVFFLGTTPSAVRANFQRGVSALGTVSLFEMPGGVQGIIDKATHTGAALYTPSQAGIQEDWTPTYGLAAVLAIGGLIAAPLIGAGTVAAGEAGAVGAGGAAAGAAGAGEGAATAGGSAAAGGAAGGGAVAGAKSVAGKIAGSTAGKIAGAAAGATVLGLFTSPSLWKGVGLVLAGAVLILLALMQFTGNSPTQVFSR